MSTDLPDDAALTPRAHRSAAAWESLFRAQVALMRRFQAEDVWDELSLREYDVLFTLSTFPDAAARLRDVNERILLSQPSLSRMVDRLAERGLVERRAAPDDARGTVVALTAEGSRLQKRIGRRHVRSIDAAVGAVLDDDELAELQRLTDKLRGY
ncbi:MarR family transcriptional regulator [Sediminihabitans luteus]|uniref:MarR family transcriptional regulator n=1 Tax=Sediminihabitans luteus TaxID=1138585 RepID=A0A2M9CDG2_9CELL|nr:MarR family winged helix-turn-helix transcriptional regulator [Sediminihabitans luteus]PJJ69927.1 MarR family transcriptional regulator [Sediminihabitans luteus]GII99247.1 hypothetical protein Slu03_16250 [Sediminihabitans luteus]